MKIKTKILIIAGSDSSGGAGIQADIKTVTALGGYAMTAITAVTAQNTKGVKSVIPIKPKDIGNQILFTCNDIKPNGIKIGMLHSSQVINSVANALKKINVSKLKQKREAILITGLPHGTDYSDEALNKMVIDMQSWKKVRMIGPAAMASCYVASGKADLYKENGIFFWDIVAGAAIVNSAGGLAEISNFQDNYQVDVIFSNSQI